MNIFRKIAAAFRAAMHWDIFKHAFDDTMRDPEVQQRVKAFLSDPIIVGHYAMLRALWEPLQKDFRDLR